MKIEADKSRFHKIISGKIKSNLKKYITNESLISHKGKDKVSIPIHNINTPRFKFGDQQTGGLGQGDGNIGDQIGQQSGPNNGQTGQSGGDHMMEVEISIEELATILGEELQLPDIKPKGNRDISKNKNRYTGIQNTGAEGLRHFKRTYKETLKREISSGTYNPQTPSFSPERKDKRYRSPKPITDPMANAVIIYMMDVSGSMGQKQKEIVRTESFWIDTWLTKQYKGIETRFIIHDVVAKEVNRETFFNTSESGGTMISSALQLCKEIIQRDYSPEDWNIYPFYFSDGDNWSGADNKTCIDIITDFLLPSSNMIAYGQVESASGSGQFLEELKIAFKNEPRVVLSEIKEKEDIIESIKTFLGKGH